MDSTLIRDLISLSGFIISLFLLQIHIRNRRTQVSSYQISRAAYRSSQIELVYLSSEQVESQVFLKLVLFNPGSIAAIIQSFAVFERVPTSNPFRRIFRSTEWRRIERARWWPTEDVDHKVPKFLEDEYKNLFVQDQRTILVKMPGYIDRRSYRFEVRTNLGGRTRETTIDGTATHFSHHYEIRYADD